MDKPTPKLLLRSNQFPKQELRSRFAQMLKFRFYLQKKTDWFIFDEINKTTTMELAKTIYSKSEIISSLQASFDQVTTCVESTPDEIFYKKKDGKWSIAENLDHLIQSTKPIASVLKKNKFFFLGFGISLSGSEKFETLRSNYLLKLSQGLAPANGGGFVSKNTESISKEKFLENWNMIGSKFPSRIEPWSETNLDRFKLPHPLLGKLTIREMLFFTVFHNEHHLRTMKILNENFQKV